MLIEKIKPIPKYIEKQIIKKYGQSNYEEHYRKCLLCKALESKAQESNKDLHYNDFERIPYEKLNSGYGHLFEHKLTTKEMLERII